MIETFMSFYTAGFLSVCLLGAIAVFGGLIYTEFFQHRGPIK